MKKVLVPELKPGQTLILDNASFHKGKKIKKVLHDAGCHLIYFPPYSPDLNPIEPHWSGLKHRIRQALPTYDHDLYKAVEHVFHKS